MGKLLLALLIVIPAVEIGVLILVGNWIGVLPTVTLIILTGVFGAMLAKKEGLNALRTAQMQASQGQVPGSILLDSVCIFIGGIILVAPGFITDVIGFLLLIPQTRAVFKGFLMRLFEKRIKRGQVVYVSRNAWKNRR